MITRFNGWPAALVVGSPAAGHSSGEAIAALEATAEQALPSGFSLAWSGLYLQEKTSRSSTLVLLLLGAGMVFLVLAAQYESWTLPLAVALTAPFAVFGAIGAAWLRGLQSDIYLQVGLIALMGLTAKNAVLIVEFATRLHQGGATTREAALQASRLRLRPILMTSATFVLGVFPLTISAGAGANSQHAVGTSVLGGMLVATLVPPLLVPTFFSWMQRLRRL
jgi:multidrug efflux pump